MKRTLIAAALSIAALAPFASAQAAVSTINGLVNTGVGATGSLDTNYRLTAASSDTTITNQYGYVTDGSNWPINPWLANDAVSKWITPTASQGQTMDASSSGTYTYHLEFNLTGYNAATATFAGRFAADNDAVVKLNNQVIATGTGFTSWTAFSANSGFQAGLNSLDFVVTNWAQNGGNPTGLRVAFDSSSVAAPVPEPETYAMLLAGMGLVGFMARRRKAK